MALQNPWQLKLGIKFYIMNLIFIEIKENPDGGFQMRSVNCGPTLIAYIVLFYNF